VGLIRDRRRARLPPRGWHALHGRRPRL